MNQSISERTLRQNEILLLICSFLEVSTDVRNACLSLGVKMTKNDKQKLMSQSYFQDGVNIKVVLPRYRMSSKTAEFTGDIDVEYIDKMFDIMLPWNIISSEPTLITTSWCRHHSDVIVVLKLSSDHGFWICLVEEHSYDPITDCTLYARITTTIQYSTDAADTTTKSQQCISILRMLDTTVAGIPLARRLMDAPEVTVVRESYGESPRMNFGDTCISQDTRDSTSLWKRGVYTNHNKPEDAYFAGGWCLADVATCVRSILLTLSSIRSWNKQFKDMSAEEITAAWAGFHLDSKRSAYIAIISPGPKKHISVDLRMMLTREGSVIFNHKVVHNHNTYRYMHTTAPYAHTEASRRASMMEQVLGWMDQPLQISGLIEMGFYAAAISF